MSKLSSVKDITIDRKTNTAKVTLKKDTSLSKDDVVKALSKTRYKVTSYVAG